MPNLAESLIALIAGPDRAVVIMGDLEELAATRGRLWFAAAYVRTLFSLTWRTMVAFFCGLASLRIVFWLLFQALHAPSMQSVPRTPLTVFFAIVVAGTAAPLWFLLPFLLVRFGRDNRMARLSCALFLSTLPGFSITFSHFSVPLLDASGFVTLAIVAAALCFKEWRKAGTVLIATLGAGTCALVIFFKVLDTAYHLAGEIHPHANNSAIRLMFGELTTSLAMLVAAAVCMRLHRRLFRSQIAGGAHV